MNKTFFGSVDDVETKLTKCTKQTAVIIDNELYLNGVLQENYVERTADGLALVRYTIEEKTKDKNKELLL
jgi:hypothetical protein